MRNWPAAPAQQQRPPAIGGADGVVETRLGQEDMVLLTQDSPGRSLRLSSSTNASSSSALRREGVDAIASALIAANDPDAKILGELASGDAIAAYEKQNGKIEL